VGKLLDVKSYDVRLKLEFKTNIHQVEFRYKGHFDIIFNSKIEILDIPFKIDPISGRPQIEFYYYKESKFERHYTVIEKTFFPILSKYVDAIFIQHFDKIKENMNYPNEIYNFGGIIEEN